MKRSTRQRTTSAVLLSAATLLIVVPAFGVLGTAMHGVPYLGLATAFVPWYVPWLIVAVLAGAALALLGGQARLHRWLTAAVSAAIRRDLVGHLHQRGGAADADHPRRG